MPLVEQADFEGCGCLLLGLFALGGAASAVVNALRGNGRHPNRLISLMTAFVTGADQSGASVEEIRSILLGRFAHDSDYTELTTAVSSFVPNGEAPFYDEVRLAEEFRSFLESQNVFVPEMPQEQPGVWPPPPKPNARREEGNQ